MDIGIGGLSDLVGVIDVHEREATAKMEAALRMRDGLSRARAALAGVLMDAPVQAAPTIKADPPTITPAAPPAVPLAATRERRRVKAPVAIKARKPKPSKRTKIKPRSHKARAAEAIVSDIGLMGPRHPLEPVVIPAPGARQGGGGGRTAPEVLPAITVSVMEIVKEHSGHPIEVVTRMVTEKRKQSGKQAERAVRLAISSLVRQNRLHRSPEGELSA